MRITQIEKIEFDLVGAAPDILRKAGGSIPQPRWFGLPAVEAEVTELVKAARDRQAEERRLSKASGRTCYQAPQHLRGRRVALATGRAINVPETGFVDLDDCAAPAGYGSAVGSGRHHDPMCAAPLEAPSTCVILSGTESLLTLRRRGVDSNFWFRNSHLARQEALSRGHATSIS
jgi:hypothetical protein